MGCALSGLDQTPSSLWGELSPGESRWPAAVAILATIGLQIALPEALTFGSRWMLPIIELALLVTLVVVNPTRLHRESTDLRIVSLMLVALLTAANGVALVLLLDQLVAPKATLAGRTLLSSGVVIWATNVISYGVWYWEIDRGGPIRRCHPDHRAPDFMFPQMENPGVKAGPWTPNFLDYLYVSLTNSTAFSPTDTLPLTRRVKALMAVQAICSLATVVVVGARAVNILG
jgi:uncharacterized membrane protein